MKQLFLTSSVNRVAHDLVKKVDLGKGNTLAFIDTAAEIEKGDKKWLKNDRKALVDAGFEVNDYTLTDKSETDLQKDLTPYQYIYLSGGNTFYLLQQAQKSGFFPLIKNWINSGEKIYIGTSAGSIMACPDIRYIEKLEDLSIIKNLKETKGFGFVNFSLLPHWGSQFFEADYRAGILLDAYKKLEPIIALTDTQYIHVTDNKSEIVQVKEKYKNNL